MTKPIVFGDVARLVSDIRFWLALVLVNRFVGITDPPIEATHSWRQTFTNMVARNMAERDIDLLHPRTDLAGERVYRYSPGTNRRSFAKRGTLLCASFMPRAFIQLANVPRGSERITKGRSTLPVIRSL